MSGPPFAIFSWRRPFLPDLKDFLEHSPNSGQAVIIVPNDRPWRYFLDLHARAGKPGLVPKMIPFGDMVDIWRARSFSRGQYLAGWLDQIGLLHQCALDVAKDDENLARHFANMEMARFLPWGMRLANMLEEMFIACVEPTDISHAEAEASPPAAALLGALGRISNRWREVLREKNFGTPGLEHYLAAADTDNIPPQLLPSADRPVFIAGFYQLNGTQDKLFKSLWNAGATVCLHTDPAIITGSAHWSCAAHGRWLGRWHAKAELAQNAPEPERAPRFSFFAGYDRHSQLERLKTEICENAESVAIVLSSPDMLMPVLHHLPSKDVNISIGYPLERAILLELLDDALAMRDRETGDGFYWRDVQKIINHPYPRMLEKTAAEEVINLRDYFRNVDKILRGGGKYVTLPTLLTDPAVSTNTGEVDFARECLDILVVKPGEAKTLRELAQALENVCEFLLAHGENLWNKFPLDAEALWRLRGNVLPALKNNSLADEKFDLPTLRGIFRQLVKDERIPFAADPLTGIQILGMLETRLLRFEHVLFLDATDDILPGQTLRDPLLPDSLRSALGLDDDRDRALASAYNLYRLCACSKSASFFWQEGVTRSALFDNKKARSRFVEQLIWDRERKCGNILKPGGAGFAAAVARAGNFVRPAKAVERSENINARLEKFLASGISPTALDAYLDCPLRFAWQYLLNLKPAVEVSEFEDASLAGTCVHDTLYNLYKPYLGRVINRKEIDGARLKNLLEERMRALNLREILSAASCLSLETAGPILLKRYLENQPQTTRIVALEKKLDATIRLNGRDYRFKGRIDRLDERNGKLILLDYKTGSHLPAIDNAIWQNHGFFAALAEYGVAHAELDNQAHEYMEVIRKYLPSLQLPCYITMLAEIEGGPIGNAALVKLADKGQEIGLFDNLKEDELDAAIGYCRQIPAFVFYHLSRAKSFPARKGGSCKWCDYAALCAS